MPPVKVLECLSAITKKVGKFKAPTENVSEKQQDSTSHVNNIENEAENTCGHRWIMPFLKENYTLIDVLERHIKWKIKQRDKLPRVPTRLREVDSDKSYDPMIVAIGPYHHGIDKPEMTNLKTQFTLEYADQSGKKIRELYEGMRDLLVEAKNYYAEDVTRGFSDIKFAEMMFLDSCFVIQFIYNCVKPGGNDLLYIRPTLFRRDITTYIDPTLIKRDIMLLENQLPFEILIKLMSLRFEGPQGKEMIDGFIKLIINDPDIKEEALNSKSEGSCKKKDPSHLLELIHTKFVDVEEIKHGKSKKPSSKYWYSYRSAKELKSMGLHFDCSKSCRFSDITFNSMHLLWSRLKLSRITIENNTKSLLLNLVAFEASPVTSSNFGVSSYVYFMDRLIDHAEDVKELRSKGIILNLFGSDEQVAKLFNEIGKNVVPDFQVFGIVQESLDAFCKSRRRMWSTECLRNHFRSPWTVIAFLAASVVVCLTIAQTVFSAIQL